MHADQNHKRFAIFLTCSGNQLLFLFGLLSFPYLTRPKAEKGGYNYPTTNGYKRFYSYVNT